MGDIYTKGFFTFNDAMRDKASATAASKRILTDDPNADVLAFEPFKHPIAWEYYLNMRQNDWTPSEIGMAKDIAQVKNGDLNQAEEHLFFSFLSMLTSMDLKTEKNIIYIIDKLGCPEWMQVGVKHMDQEATHTWAYKYIIDQMGLEGLDIFYRWDHVDVIRHKVDFAAHVTSRLAKLNVKDEADVEELLVCLAFWYVGFEWGWFGSALASVPSLNRKSLLPGTTEQFWYIMRDEWTHLDYGANLINLIREEHPGAWTRDTTNSVASLLLQMIELEDAVADEFLRPGLLTINKEDYKLHVRRNFAQAAGMIGIELDVQGRELSWYRQMITTSKMKNFFETRVTEYRTGGVLNWD